MFFIKLKEVVWQPILAGVVFPRHFLVRMATDKDDNMDAPEDDNGNASDKDGGNAPENDNMDAPEDKAEDKAEDKTEDKAEGDDYCWGCIGHLPV